MFWLFLVLFIVFMIALFLYKRRNLEKDDTEKLVYDDTLLKMRKWEKKELK